ncbi:hypothetical protein AXG93_4280s1010 [Marchantia polymorpha subsp. ruderalis]|uniref:Uncharacterized protein n=1 Tax=Marchantia polymorpha subsp. ruderalis TaxID=1480154 RepID=A0A176WP39_MARPO|nr:hypothetical protein AXG93_4280s1010 [Marchantia polymorpha subsp. ruderalis]
MCIRKLEAISTQKYTETKLLTSNKMALIFTHVTRQSKQKTWSQAWRKALLSLTFSRQIGHSSKEVPSTAPPHADIDASEAMPPRLSCLLLSSAAPGVSDLHDVEEESRRATIPSCSGEQEK